MAYIINSTSNTLITGTSNDDSIYNSAFRYVTIDASDGNDTIRSYYAKGDYMSIYGGAGNDYIVASSFSEDSTYEGGLGNDTIDMPGNDGYSTLVYSSGDGNDVINDYVPFNTVYIKSGKINNVTGSGDDVVLVVGSGSMTFKESKNVPIYLENADKSNNTIVYNGSSTIPVIYNDSLYGTLNGTKSDEYIFNKGNRSTLDAGAGDDTIYIVGNYISIKGGDGDDSIVNAINQGFFSTFEGGLGNDTIKLYNSQSSIIDYAKGDGHDVVLGWNYDTIRIKDDSKYYTVKSGSDVIVKFDDGSITVKDINLEYRSVDISGGTYDSTGSDPTMPGDPTVPSSSEIVKLTNDTLSPYTADAAVVTIDGSARTKAINITANAKDNVIIGGTKNDTFTGGAGNDTFFYADGSGKDIITDYTVGEDVIKLTSGDIKKATANKKGDLTFTIGKGSIKLNGGVGKQIKITDSSDNIIFNQSFGEKTLKVTNSDADTINSAIDSVAVTIDSSERTTSVDLTGNAKANYFKTSAANETITTGKGKDTIEYNGGNKVITDYTAGQDKLKLSVDLTNATVRENDVVLTTSSGTITLKDAKGKKITTIDKDSKTTSMIYGSSSTTIANADGDAFTALGDMVVLDASKRTKPVNLIGNSAANTLIGGRNGKKKFDTLTGGAGADTFVYNSGGGNDIITDYSAAEGDIIQLGAKTQITGATYSGNDLVFTIGKGKVTVQGAASQTVTVLDSNNLEMTFKQSSRNTTTQGFEERWFTEDNNFITNKNIDNDLNSIIDDKADIAVDYKFSNENNFAQKFRDSLLTCGESKRNA